MDETTNVGANQSIETMFSIIKFMQEHGEAGVTETANELGLAKSTAHRYLATLKRLEFAVKDPEDHTYRLGLRFIGISEDVKNRDSHYQMAHQKAKQLARSTGERAQFIVEEHDRGIYVHRERGEQAVKTDAREGKRVHLSATAAGKAILAYLPRSRVEEIIDRYGLPQYTDNTIVSEEELYQQLEEIQERGYAINREEYINGLYAVGAPIRTSGGAVLGALSVSGPTNRVKDQMDNGDIPKLLRGAINEIELNLEYS